MAECSCIYVDDYIADDPKFIRSKTVKARKSYECCECRRTIEKGEIYQRTFGVYSGYSVTFITCSTCQEIIEVFFCNGCIYEGMYECLTEHIHDFRGEIDSSCIASLSEKAREVICDLIEEYWENHEGQ